MIHVEERAAEAKEEAGAASVTQRTQKTQGRHRARCDVATSTPTTRDATGNTARGVITSRGGQPQSTAAEACREKRAAEANEEEEAGGAASGREGS